MIKLYLAFHPPNCFDGKPQLQEVVLPQALPTSMVVCRLFHKKLLYYSSIGLFLPPSGRDVARNVSTPATTFPRIAYSALCFVH